MCSNFIETLLEKKLKISNLEKTKECHFFPKVLQYNDNTGTAPYADLFRVRLAREEGGGWREGGQHILCPQQQCYNSLTNDKLIPTFPSNFIWFCPGPVASYRQLLNFLKSSNYQLLAALLTV